MYPLEQEAAYQIPCISGIYVTYSSVKVKFQLQCSNNFRNNFMADGHHNIRNYIQGLQH